MTRLEKMQQRVSSNNIAIGYKLSLICDIAILIAISGLSKKKSGYFISPKNRVKLYVRDQYTCVYCKQTFTKNELQLDHIVPRKIKVDNSFENLVTSCFPCNRAKWHYTLDSYISYLNVSGINTTITAKDVINQAKKTLA